MRFGIKEIYNTFGRTMVLFEGSKDLYIYYGRKYYLYIIKNIEFEPYSAYELDRHRWPKVHVKLPAGVLP